MAHIKEFMHHINVYRKNNAPTSLFKYPFFIKMLISKILSLYDFEKCKMMYETRKFPSYHMFLEKSYIYYYTFLEAMNL